MKLEKEYKRVNKYIIENILQLPLTYVLSDYNELIFLWEDLKKTPEMEEQLKEARQKTINADILIKLNEVITLFNENETSSEIDPNFRKSIIKTIENAKKYIDIHSNGKYSLYFEHDLAPNSTYVELTIKGSEEKQVEIKTDLDFSPFWGILESEKWDELVEHFEGIFLEDEEFIQEFQYALKLQSYLKFYTVLKELKLFESGNRVLPKGMKIVIGQHDCYEFEFEVK